MFKFCRNFDHCGVYVLAPKLLVQILVSNICFFVSVSGMLAPNFHLVIAATIEREQNSKVPEKSFDDVKLFSQVVVVVVVFAVVVVVNLRVAEASKLPENTTSRHDFCPTTFCRSVILQDLFLGVQIH